ncbi:MAG: protease I [Saprospiraceae bacterium]|jgi:protease I
MKRILIPLPTYGFDPSEAAIPWKIISEHNIDITFITPDGKQAQGDKIMLTGKGLGVLKPILAARKDAVAAYSAMELDEKFRFPLSYDEVKAADFDGILLPGGHDKGIIEYLESETLQNLIVDFFKAQKIIGAICHGVVLVARSTNPETGKSVIYNYQTTALLKSQESLAYNLTRFWLQDYYLTYPEITVEDEVKSVLSDSNNFIKGALPLFKDSNEHLKRGFVVKDRNYLSARWPGDVYNFALEFVRLIQNEKTILF